MSGEKLFSFSHPPVSPLLFSPSPVSFASGLFGWRLVCQRGVHGDFSMVGPSRGDLPDPPPRLGGAPKVLAGPQPEAWLWPFWGRFFFAAQSAEKF